MPPFLSPSSGRSSRYRRRIVPPSTSPDHFPSNYSNSAVAAAELAASSIVSDTPKRTANAPHNNSSTVPKLSSSTTVIQNLRASRARLLQRNNYESREQRWLKLKLVCFGVIFVIGVLWIGKKGEVQPHHSLRHDHHSNNYDDKKRVGSSINEVNNSNNNSQKLSVPLPPNVKGSDSQEKISNLNFHHKKHSGKKHVPKVNSVTNNSVNDNKESSSSQEIATKTTTNKVQQNNHHGHIIPPILTFTYHTNLLTTPTSELQDSEDRSLSQNVQQITTLHPESTIRFLNDDDCLQSIKATLGMDTNLTNYFLKETHGMYKADICRGAALYETGGLYFDIDVETRSIPLWQVIDPQTEFVTTLVHKDSNHLGRFFQAFIGVVPGHPVMKRYLELFVEYYEGKVKVKGPLGVYFLRMAYDEVISKDDQEKKTELWQEVRYSPEEFPEIHRSRWGKRRACQMMLVAPPKRFDDGFERKERMMPIFSHANGSRMCGGKDANIKGNSDTA